MCKVASVSEGASGRDAVGAVCFVASSVRYCCRPPRGNRMTWPGRVHRCRGRPPAISIRSILRELVPRLSRLSVRRLGDHVRAPQPELSPHPARRRRRLPAGAARDERAIHGDRRPRAVPDRPLHGADVLGGAGPGCTAAGRPRTGPRRPGRRRARALAVWAALEMRRRSGGRGTRRRRTAERPSTVAVERMSITRAPRSAPTVEHAWTLMALARRRTSHEVSGTRRWDRTSRRRRPAGGSAPAGGTGPDRTVPASPTAGSSRPVPVPRGLLRRPGLLHPGAGPVRGGVRGRSEALEAASRCADRLAALQGDQGQWWWHYDWGKGAVVERYPVYSVHQHGLAPMALLELWEAGGPDHRAAVAHGLGWLVRHPETAADLIADEVGVVWRKVGRREPSKLVRKARSAASADRTGGCACPGWTSCSRPVGSIASAVRSSSAGCCTPGSGRRAACGLRTGHVPRALPHVLTLNGLRHLSEALVRRGWPGPPVVFLLDSELMSRSLRRPTRNGTTAPSTQRAAGGSLCSAHADPAPDARPKQDEQSGAARALCRRRRPPDAWDTLVTRYVALLWSIAFRHGLNENDAADVVQNTWLRLFEHIDDLREPARVARGSPRRPSGRRCASSRSASAMVPSDDEATFDGADRLQAPVDEDLLARELAAEARGGARRTCHPRGAPSSWR